MALRARARKVAAFKAELAATLAANKQLVLDVAELARRLQVRARRSDGTGRCLRAEAGVQVLGLGARTCVPSELQTVPNAL